MNGRQFWITVFLMVLSGVAGYYANILANRKNNELLVQMIKDQLGCVNDEIATGTTEGKISTDRLVYLSSRRSYLESQLSYYSKKFNIYT